MVDELISTIENKSKQQDAIKLLALMQDWSGYEPHQAGSMIGFGRYHYRYESGREGDFFVTGFAIRKQNIALYIVPGFDQYQQQLAQLGKHKTGKSCLYINRLADVDLNVLAAIVSHSVEYMQQHYSCSEFNENHNA